MGRQKEKLSPFKTTLFKCHVLCRFHFTLVLNGTAWRRKAQENKIKDKKGVGVRIAWCQ